MIRTVVLAGVLALGFVAMPASAASDAFVAGAAAWEEANASDTRPSEQSDFAYCGGYWEAWSTSIADGAVPQDELKTLPLELQPPSTEFAAMSMFLMIDEANPLESEVEAAGAKAYMLIEELLAGDVEAAQSVFRSLGMCQLEPE